MKREKFACLHRESNPGPWVTGPTLYRLSYRGSRQSESRILTEWRRRFSLFIKHGHRDAKLASFWSRYYSQLVFAWVNPKAWFWHIYILNKWREKNLLASTGIEPGTLGYRPNTLPTELQRLTAKWIPNSYRVKTAIFSLHKARTQGR